MTPDEAFENFSAAFDDQLGPTEKEQFDKVLAENPEIKEEFIEFCTLLQQTAQLALDDEDDAPDLMAGVQGRIRARSRGRFYRDRFSSQRQSGTLLPVLVGAGMLLVIAIAWFFLNHVIVEG